jgi:hypothetical protein
MQGFLPAAMALIFLTWCRAASQSGHRQGQDACHLSALLMAWMPSRSVMASTLMTLAR